MLDGWLASSTRPGMNHSPDRQPVTTTCQEGGPPKGLQNCSSGVEPNNDNSTAPKTLQKDPLAKMLLPTRGCNSERWSRTGAGDKW